MSKDGEKPKFDAEFKEWFIDSNLPQVHMDTCYIAYLVGFEKAKKLQKKCLTPCIKSDIVKK